MGMGPTDSPRGVQAPLADADVTVAQRGTIGQVCRLHSQLQDKVGKLLQTLELARAGNGCRVGALGSLISLLIVVIVLIVFVEGDA